MVKSLCVTPDAVLSRYENNNNSLWQIMEGHKALYYAEYDMP